MGKHKKRTRSEDRKEETKKLRRELRDLKDLVMQCLAAKSRDDASNRDAYDSDDSISEEDPPSDVDSQDIREEVRDPEAPQTPETGAKNGSPDRPGDTGSAPETTSQAAPAQQEDTTTGTKTPTESVSQKNKEPEGAPSLNEEVIKIIGKPPETEEACQKIHPDVSVRWNAWLKSGLKKEEKDELLKNYPRGGSCLLEAPILNPEIASTLNESAPKRDKYFCATQKLAGSSLSALAPAITLLLENETVDSKTILTNIWDAAKILAELHHSQSVARQATRLKNPKCEETCPSQFGKLERPVSNSKTDHLDGPEIQISEVGNSPEDTIETVQPEQNEPDPESGLSSSALVQQQQHQQQIEDSLSDQQIQRHGTSTEQKPYPGGREIIRQALLNKNTSEESAEIMIASVENSTLKQYESSYKLWWEFNQETQSDPFSITAKKVLSFLTKRFQDGASYGTINSGKAALALIAREEIANSDLINRFMRGVYKKRPGRPRYDTIWDVDPVLDKLAEWYPLEPLKLKKVTKKLVLLLALGTAHRIQTLAAIKISNIIETQKGLEIKIPEHIKTSRAGAVQPLLKLPFFEHKPGLCIARTLLHYLTITKDLRGKEDYLLISFQKPHAKVSRDTIGRWIKSTLKELGVDERYTAHSTRHAATSKAAEKGVNIDEIKRIAGWSQKSKVFADFYNLPIKIQDDDFAKRVMLT
ncbi:uncharacterized protein LOC124178226 [Neodiprion fabricii]|uniref:uncharacterized protein LOC124178226 n=1 Tax=Neodiprion fabricii TaxID=2872261 RepID=UPI001ED959A7|nr:uncharacterized protein LOC124178226 [Neodiprion fabricii]